MDQEWLVVIQCLVKVCMWYDLYDIILVMFFIFVVVLIFFFSVMNTFALFPTHSSDGAHLHRTMPQCHDD